METIIYFGDKSYEWGPFCYQNLEGGSLLQSTQFFEFRYSLFASCTVWFWLFWTWFGRAQNDFMFCNSNIVQVPISHGINRYFSASIPIRKKFSSFFRYKKCTKQILIVDMLLHYSCEVQTLLIMSLIEPNYFYSMFFCCISDFLFLFVMRIINFFWIKSKIDLRGVHTAFRCCGPRLGDCVLWFYPWRRCCQTGWCLHPFGS